MHLLLKFIFGIKLYMFRTVFRPSSGVFRCTHSNGICHTGLLTAVSKPVCQQTCMTYTIVLRTVKIS